MWFSPIGCKSLRRCQGWSSSTSRHYRWTLSPWASWPNQWSYCLLFLVGKAITLTVPLFCVRALFSRSFHPLSFIFKNEQLSTFFLVYCGYIETLMDETLFYLRKFSVLFPQQEVFKVSKSEFHRSDCSFKTVD